MLMQSSCQVYGWSVEYTLDLPILMLMLMLRQKCYVDSEGKQMTLLQQEKIASNADIPWEEQIRRNREEISKRFGRSAE